jgi:hypothetical protein
MRGFVSKRMRLFAALALLPLGAVLVSPSAQAFTQSQNVAIVTTPTVTNGGDFATTDGAFAGFSFTNVPVTGLSNLATACGGNPCDTVLLNVASSVTVRCNLNNITAQQKADLVSFVHAGGKLIIYDSECSSQDYSWLPYPFTTNNPGAQGATGTVSIVEDNALSTKVGDPTCTSGDPLCINATLLGTTTDAVGDMNVMTTLDQAWCLDMSGTNVNAVTGPTHTYARYGSGLIIYNGFDVDAMRSYTPPVNTTGAGNLAKIWLQELQVPFNPMPFSALPCGITVIGITISPLTAVNDLGAGETTHTVTARLTDLTGTPQPGILVDFEVLAGSENAGAIGNCSVNADCTTDANGEVSFTYSSNWNTGSDTIKACFDDQGTLKCASATKDWVDTGPGPLPCDVDGDGDVDKLDLTQISRSRGQIVLPGDPRDANGDGVITPADVKVCIPQCTNPGCAVQ